MTMRMRIPLLVAAAAATLTGCATAERIGGAVTAPFARDRSAEKKAPDEGRISVLQLEEQLKVAGDLAGRAPVVPAARPMANWPSPGGEADNAPQNVAGEAALTVAWRRNVAAGSSNETRLAAAPVIADGKLFMLDSEQVVHAIDAATGRDVWRVALKSANKRDKEAIGGGVAFADGRLYVSSGFGMVLAMDSTNGKEIWRATADAPFSSAPTIGAGRVFAVTNDSELIAMDSATGAVSWTHQAIAEPARVLAASSAAIAGDTVISPFPSGELIALLAANGRRLWTDALTRTGRLTSLSAINDIAGRPAVVDGVVYAASHSGILAAIDQRTGQRLWELNFASTQTPWVSGDAAYAVNIDGELVALERTSGKVFWISELRRFENQKKKKDRIAWVGPVMVGGKLVLANSLGQVIRVNPIDGKTEREVEIGGAAFIPPVAANGMVYFMTDEGRLVALK
jgi:outer membrane protein assembly factor BamB